MISSYIHIYLFIGWLFFSYIEGVREAYYYHSASRDGDSDKYNIHYLYSIQRILFLIGMCFYFSPIQAVVLTVSAILSFPLIHDGSFYSKRNDLNKELYLKRWKDDSKTSTAVVEIKYIRRVIYFIAGVLLFITHCIIWQ